MSADALLLSVDLLLRGGVCMLLLLVAGVMLRDYGRIAAGRLGAFFALGTAAFALCSAAGFHARLGLWAIPLMALATGNNIAFWLFARALFDDGFKPKAWHGGLWLGMVAIGLVDGLVLDPRTQLARGLCLFMPLAAMGFGLLAAAQTLASWRDDLIERRRRLRVFIVGACAGYITLNTLANLLGAQRAASEAASAVQALALAAVAGAISWSLLRVAGDDALFGPPIADPAAKVAAPAPLAAALSGADAAAAAALERALSFDRVYRQDRLTIGALARQLDLPEHRLRRLINQALGQRNFNSFLNGYRIADAKAALADPSQAGVGVLTIALDAGFGSLGPFNRAFKAETGLTPTEYRRLRRGQPTATERAEFGFGQAVSLSADGISNSA